MIQHHYTNTPPVFHLEADAGKPVCAIMRGSPKYCVLVCDDDDDGEWMSRSVYRRNPRTTPDHKSAATSFETSLTRDSVNVVGSIESTWRAVACCSAESGRDCSLAAKACHGWDQRGAAQMTRKRNLQCLRVRPGPGTPPRLLSSQTAGSAKSV